MTKLGPVEMQLKALREARWRETHPEPVSKPVAVSNVSSAVSSPPVSSPPVSSPPVSKVERREYMRELMRRKRAAAKAALTISLSSAA